METRRAVLRRAAWAAIGGAAALLAACDGPVQVAPPGTLGTATVPAPTPTTTRPPEPTREPPRPRPPGAIGAGIGAATPAGTPRVAEGFARARLRIIHAAPARAALVLTVDDAEIGTVRYPEATTYVDILFGARRIAGASAAGAAFAITLEARDNVAYTVVIVGDGATTRAIVIADDQPVAPAGSCRVRFLPLEATAGSLDLAIADGPTLATGVAPFATGPSVAVPAGVATLEVRAPGQATPLLTKPPIGLDAGDRYTAVLSGSAAARTLRLTLYPDAAAPADQ